MILPAFGSGVSPTAWKGWTARTALLAPCAARCADSCPVGLYEKLWAQSQGEPDAFFQLLGIAYCLGRVWPGHRFTVTKEKTILQGDACCCFLVALA